MELCVKYLIFVSLCFNLASSQQQGNVKPENHPPLTVSFCRDTLGCTQVQKSIVLDSNWRWVHDTQGYTNCFTGTTWDSHYCPDPTTCANNCALDGGDYSNTYGITTSGDQIRLGFVTGSNVGSRVYLLDSENEYQMFKLKNREFSFDVDVSTLPCGLNGALYFVEMDSDGGKEKYAGNKAGAKFGTGYCDAQCPHDLKWINGEANILDWDSQSSTGRYGTCCTEMDIWEANSRSQAYTAHPCSVTGQVRCDGQACGDGNHRFDGLCDKDGCDLNPYRLGNLSFYGKGHFDIDTSKMFTVVTQFITHDNTDDGDLVEIRRLYVQDKKIITSPAFNIGDKQYNSISDDFCTAEKNTFKDTNDFAAKGGLKAVGDALGRGMALVISLWDDHAANMLWLDSDYPTDVPNTNPGVKRGPCPTSSGVPSDVETKYPNSYVSWSNIRFGDINSTVELLADDEASSAILLASGV